LSNFFNPLTSIFGLKSTRDPRQLYSINRHDFDQSPKKLTACTWGKMTCALRKSAKARRRAMRDGRWVFLDFLGKGNKTRSVAVPLWLKQEIDGWLDVAGIEKGPIFRRVLANGRVGKDALTERAVAAGARVRSADRDRRPGAA
jgi:hypothetical protein